LSLLNDEDDSPTGSIAVLDKEKQLSELIVKRLQIVEDARWKFEIGNQTIEVKAQVDRIVKTVIFAKDFVSSAVSSDPHAALAWAGVCVLMPVSVTNFFSALPWSRLPLSGSGQETFHVHSSFIYGTKTVLLSRLKIA